MRRAPFILIFVLIFASLVFSQEKVSTNDLKTDFSKYENERIMIEGFITQWIPDAAQTTEMYFLKDDWGGIIRVRTSMGHPEVGKKFQVIGVVDKDDTTDDIFISEESRILLDEEGGDNKITFMEWISKNWPYLAAGAGILIIILLVVIILYALRQRKAMTTDISVTPTEGEEPGEEEPEPSEIVEGKTVKMAVPPPGTLKLLPGKFVVLEGDEKIDEIRFYKEKGTTETEITFGRAEKKGYSHIQLKPRTVSAKQAKLIYAGEDFTLINYSKTNPTRVNEEDLSENDSVKLKDGDKIEMGEMIFEFKITK